jgi:hypothetical protein
MSTATPNETPRTRCSLPRLAMFVGTIIGENPNSRALLPRRHEGHEGTFRIVQAILGQQHTSQFRYTLTNDTYWCAVEQSRSS